MKRARTVESERLAYVPAFGEVEVSSVCAVAGDAARARLIAATRSAPVRRRAWTIDSRLVVPGRGP